MNKSIKEQALAELRNERIKEAKDALKSLLRRKADAKKVLANIQREIDDYMLQLEQDGDVD